MSGCRMVRYKPTDTQGINQPKAIQYQNEPKSLSSLVSTTYRQA